MKFLVGSIVVAGLFVCILVTTAVTIAVKGLVLSMTWQWFVVPLFGLPALSVVQAIGIMLVATLLTHQLTESSKNNDEQSTWEKISEPFESAGKSILANLGLLGVAAIVRMLL